nr:MAG TPA: hypothetical protein [Crassvirales sp.]
MFFSINYCYIILNHIFIFLIINMQIYKIYHIYQNFVHVIFCLITYI